MRRVDEIEGLRAFVAWWVVLGHIFLLSDFRNGEGKRLHDLLRPLMWIIARPELAVDIFMMISGFVIFFLLHHQRLSYRQFLTGRFFRLYPLYAFCMLAAVAISPLEHENLARLASAANDFRDRIARIDQWHDHFALYGCCAATLLQGTLPEAWLPNASKIFLPPSWSITLEWQFYLLAPLIYLCTWKRWNWARWIFLALLVVAAFVGPRIAWNYALILRFLGWFMVGILSFYLFTRLEDRDRPIFARRENFIHGCSVLFLLLLNSLPLFIWGNVLLTICAERIFASPPYLTRLIRGILLHRLSQIFGRISYSIYLTHWIVIQLVLQLIFWVFGTVDRQHLAAWTLAPVLILTSVVSLATYYAIERPGIRLGHRLAAQMKGPDRQKRRG